MSSLLALPDELLQNVATLLPYYSLVDLMCTNRQLHRACNEASVFQAVAKYGHYHDPTVIEQILKSCSNRNMPHGYDRVKLDTSHIGWPEGKELLATSTLEQSRKIAYAVYRCTRAAFTPTYFWHPRLRLDKSNSDDFLQWLPHLIALNHPLTWAVSPHDILLVHGQLTERPSSSIASSLFSLMLSQPQVTYSPRQIAEFVNINFILSAITLELIDSIRDRRMVVKIFEEFLAIKPTGDVPHPDSKSYQYSLKDLWQRVPDYGSLPTTFTPEQASSIIVPLALSIVTEYVTGDFTNNLPRSRSKRIPYTKFMDIPDVYSNSVEAFSTCHLRYMTDPGFLTGTWNGYYSEHRTILSLSANYQPTIDEPMCDIHMIATPPPKGDSTPFGLAARIESETTGHDAVGRFTLSGEVMADGRVRMAKRYEIGWAWTWTGRVTPFGIVGAWGSRLGFGGYFWIWKEDW